MASFSTERMASTRATACTVGPPFFFASVAALREAEPGPEQRLADVDIAEARDDALVHQERLESRAALRPRGQARYSGVSAPSSGSTPSAVKQRVLGQLRVRDQQHIAEAARIAVGDGRAARHAEHGVGVLGVAGLTVFVVADLVRLGFALALHGEPPRHAEVHDQRLMGR